jgi:hypothetical protein
MMDHDHLLDAVATAVDDPEFRARLFGVLARAGLYHPPRAHLIHYRAQAAEKLLSSGQMRPQVREALQVRFGVSRRSAYRLIERALNSRQMNLFGDDHADA